MPSITGRAAQRAALMVPEHQAAVGAAEAERVAQHCRSGARSRLRAGSARAAPDRRPRASAAGHEAVLEREHGRSRLDRCRRRPARGRSRPWSSCTATVAPNSAAPRASSVASLVGRGGAVQVDVVDRVGVRVRRRAAPPASPAARPALPDAARTCGARRSTRRRRAARSRRRPAARSAVRTPRLRRSRCRRARRRRAGTARARAASSEWKPYSVVRHSVSTPPTTAASITSGRDHARGRGEGLGARRAGGRDAAHAARAARGAAHELGQRERVVRAAVVEVAPAARRSPGPGGDRRARSRGCPRCWCRRTRRCGRHRSARARSRTASAKPSCSSASCASRLLRQSNAARSACKPTSSSPSTSATIVSSCTVSKRQGASAERRSASAEASASLPRPRPVTAV